MMYILTQSEMDELNQRNIKAAADLHNTLQDLCTRIANTELVKTGWYEGKPWGCVLTVEHEWYCDDCPVQTVCPLEWKHWSK
jgi:hypothetical protein